MTETVEVLLGLAVLSLTIFVLAYKVPYGPYLAAASIGFFIAMSAFFGQGS